MSDGLDQVLEIHAHEAAALYDLRTAFVAAPHITLRDLVRLDDRLAAHFDGLAVGGEQAWPFCAAALDPPSAGAVFVAAVRAIEQKEEDRLGRLFLLAEDHRDARHGLTAAFGWLDGKQLQGVVASLLASEAPAERAVGIAACSMHRVDPGLVTARRIMDPQPLARARALRAAGEIGCQDAIAACVSAIGDDDPQCGFWSAWSSVLLGNQGIALDALTGTGVTGGPHRARAFGLALQSMTTSRGHAVLQQLATQPEQLRSVIRGSGIVGDATYVPWLIGHMAKPATERLAGEAFTLITGADLDALQLYRARPDDFESGPTDDPDDPNVEIDPDEGLPWPDVAKVEQWWAANGSRFQKGTRCFMGAPVTRAHCVDVLETGCQRQRILAAHHLCLLEPGTPLFNTSAPAWRQKKLLAQMDKG